MPEHTEFPWRIDEDDPTEILNLSGSMVAHCYRIDAENVVIQRAELIVLAVNHHAELVACVSAFMKLVSDGMLVRDISEDASPGWAMKQLPLIKTLKSADDLLRKLGA